MQMIETDVVIVGAGPAGALLACLLAKQGVAVTLVEKHAALGREFRGEHLHDDSLVMLKRHGLWDEVKAAGVLPMQAVEMMDGRKAALTVTPALFGIDHVGIHIPQAHLLEPMVRQASASPDFRLLLGAAVHKLLRDGAGRVTGVDVQTADGPLQINARITVGADGRYSAVRKHSGIPVEVWKHGYDIVWAKVPAPAGWPAALRFGHYGEHGFALFTAWPHHVQLGWRIPEGGFKQIREGSVQAFTDIIASAFPELAPAVKAQLKDWSDFTVLSVQSSMAERWAADGLMLIGDAAHTMSPAGGIGVNTAMADSEVAVNVILEALAKDDLSEALLRGLEHQRRALIAKQQATQREQEAKQVAATKSRLTRWFFYFGMKMLNRSPMKRAFFLKNYASAKA